MKKNCSVVRDLLPLYIDDVCSEESKELVKNHLKSCKECNNYLEDLKSNINTSEINEVNIIKSFAKKINFKIIINVIIYTCVILAGIIGFLAFYGNYEFTMNYNKKMEIFIWNERNNWNFEFGAPTSGRDYTLVMQTEENGEIINNIFITRKFTPQDFIESKDSSTSYTGTDLDYQKIRYDDNMRVYYTTEKFDKIKNASKEELKKIINKSTLIFNNEQMTTTLNCTLNNIDYNYSLTYYKINNQIVDSIGDESMPNDLLIDIISGNRGNYKNLWFPGDKATDILDKAESYINDKGGSCSRENK